VQANRRFNLTRITSPGEAAVKHYADSLSLLSASWFDPAQSLKVLDVGTGAGYPAIPLAIVCENWQITAIDGTGKKARFVKEAAEALGLSNLQARQVRAADLAGERGEKFDLILFRAVCQLAKGLKEVQRRVADGGAVVFYKAAGLTAEEIEEGAKAAQSVGFAESGRYRLQLPSPEGTLERVLIRYTQ